MSKPKITEKKAYEKEYRRRFSQDFSGPSKVDQSFKATCDVNAIIAKYIQTGIDPAPGQAPQNFGFASSKTYSEVAREMAEVDSAFASLPSAERSHYRNDPGAWLDAIATPEPPAPEKDPSEGSQEPSDPSPTPPPPEDSTPSEAA